MSVSANTQAPSSLVARIRGAINAHPRVVVAVAVLVAALDVGVISTALGS